MVVNFEQLDKKANPWSVVLKMLQKKLNYLNGFFFVKTQFSELHLATTHIISESSSASNTSKLLQLIPMTAKS